MTTADAKARMIARLGDVLDIIAAAEHEFARTPAHRVYYTASHAAVNEAITALEAPHGMTEAMTNVRQRLVNAADHQCTKRGDYLYKGHPDAWMADSIREIDEALAMQAARPIDRDGVGASPLATGLSQAEPEEVSALRASIPSACEYDAVFVPMAFERPVGRDLDEWRENVYKTELYRRGDTVLVWVNEGDLYCDGPFVKQLRRKPASGTEAGTGETVGLDPKGDGPVAESETPEPGPITPVQDDER